MTVPEKQKAVAVVAVLVLGATVGLHFWLLKPLIDSNAGLAKNEAELRQDLRGRADRTWKLRESYLGQLRRMYEKQSAKASADLLRVSRKAMPEFQDLIDPYDNGQSFQDWRAGVYLFDYQDRFNKTRRRLQRRQVYLYEDYLGLEESSVMPRGEEEYTYRLLVKIYLVERLANLCRDHGLDLGNPEFDYGGGNKANPKYPPAMIKALPVREHRLRGDAAPFMEEYPIRVTVRGKLAQLMSLLDGLTAGEHFLPLGRIAVKADGAERFDKPGYNRYGHEDIEVTLECSGMLVDMQQVEKALKESGADEHKRNPTPTGA